MPKLGAVGAPGVKLAWRPDIPKTPLMRRRMLWAYAFVAAPVIALLVFLLGPILFSGWVSLHRWDMLSPVSEMPWRGLSNYSYLLSKDPVFLKALGNTFYFAIGGVGANTILGLGFRASAQQPHPWARHLARTLFHARDHGAAGPGCDVFLHIRPQLRRGEQRHHRLGLAAPALPQRTANKR